jgi:hypothetical protein
VLSVLRDQSESSIPKAVALNNTEFQGKHLRIDHLGRDTSKDYQRSAFMGNLPFDIKDEEVSGVVVLVRALRERRI